MRIYHGPLRPASIDESRARALAGEVPPAGASRELVELYETRGAIRGEDPPSRRLLGSLAESLGVDAIILVTLDVSGAGTARVFLRSTGAFDAARYSEGVPSPSNFSGTSWDATVASLERTFAPAVPVIGPGSNKSNSANTEATQHRPNDDALPTAPRPFYKSPWLWGAIGLALVVGGALYLGAQTGSAGEGPEHVMVRVPR